MGGSDSNLRFSFGVGVCEAVNIRKIAPVFEVRGVGSGWFDFVRRRNCEG